MTHKSFPDDYSASGLRAALTYNTAVRPNSELLATLRTALPQFFDVQGNFKSDKFDAELKANDVAEARDGYKLGFVGKDYARLQTGRRSETVLAPDCAHNALPENAGSGNVFITGDNLEALRHLVNAYEGKIKLIYIDPPYNTGKEFVYSDKFEFDDEKLRAALGYTDAEIERLKSIQGKSSHSAWLTFMYPRLKLAQKLLRDDGVIFVSIDDNEQANLKLLMDEVFGEGNFVGNIAWESKAKSQNTETAYDKLQPKVEHIFVYTRKDGNRFKLVSKGQKDYSLTDTQGKYREHILEVMSATGIRGRESMVFEIKGIMPPSGKQWKLGRDQVSAYESTGNLFVRDEKIVIKMRPQEERTEKTEPFWAFLAKEIGTAESAKKEVTELFNIDNIFDTVKPIDLIKRLLFHASTKDAIVLDFFAGSATTAHAVMQLNAEDGGNRKYIMVQWAEPTNEDSEARKAGYNTIDEISRERIKRAGKKILADYVAKEKENAGNLRFADDEEKPRWDKDIGFKHFRLVTPDVKTLDKIETFDPSAPVLFAADMVTPFARPETKTSGLDTLLATWLIDDGFPFDTPVDEIVISGQWSVVREENTEQKTSHSPLTTNHSYKAYLVKSKLYLIALDWGAAQTKDLLNRIGTNELNIQHIVVYAYSFKMESLRELEINIKNTLDADHQVYVERRY
jgi:adenine-specific DNA-methyltransferase